MGFSMIWRDWISIMLRSSSSSCHLDGVNSDSIGHRWGLRQGQSPFMFILSIDPVERVLEVVATLGALSPLPGRETKLRIGLYADNAIIFSNPDRNEIDNLLQILEGSDNAIGLHINPSKSSVEPIYCHGIDLDNVLQGFGGSRVGLPITYLGLSITLGSTRRVHLQFIFNRIKAKIAGRKGKIMNHADRRVIVRSLLVVILSSP